MQELMEIMRKLRAPGGCPWDREQTHQSLRPYLVEEAAEAVEAIESDDPHWMTEELGDVLLQVAFHAVIGEETGRFAYSDIERAIVDKLIRRHPHVFGQTQVADSAEVVSNWQAIKAQESGKKGGVPAGLPTLMRAAAVCKQQSRTTTAAELHEQTRTLEPTAQSVAELALALVRYAQSQQLDLEWALRDYLNSITPR